jgi:hypothetical protein
MGRNDFDGEIHFDGPKNQDCFGPEMATSEASAIWAQ